VPSRDHIEEQAGAFSPFNIKERVQRLDLVRRQKFNRGIAQERARNAAGNCVYFSKSVET